MKGIKIKFLGFAVAFCVVYCPLWATTFSKTDLVTDIAFDNFGDLVNGKTFNGFLISVSAPLNNAPWDLYVENGVTITQISQYSTQGALLPLSAINIRAFNLCATPDQDYGAGIRPIPAITGSFAAPFTMAGPHYVVGTAGPDLVMMDNQGACNGLLEINDDGTGTANPTTHTFRFDFNVVPGVAAIIQPGVYRFDMNITISDETLGPILTLMYSLTIEIQPILQLKMSTPSQIDFNFTEIKDYNGGITKYGATRLEVNSSVNWDLVAVGTSTVNESSLGVNHYWDNAVSYTAGGSPNIPLDILELVQSPANPTAGQSGVGLDYSPALTTPASGNNNIEVAYGSGVSLTAVAPYTLGKTIAGNWGTAGAGNMMPPGSYLTINAGWNRANYTYMISYRLLPGLPVIFPNTFLGLLTPLIGGMSPYARPGVYTMQVKYLLVEDL